MTNGVPQRGTVFCSFDFAKLILVLRCCERATPLQKNKIKRFFWSDSSMHKDITTDAQSCAPPIVSGAGGG